MIDHDYVCQACTERPPRYRKARAALHYNQIGKDLVTGFKYRHALWLEPLLIDLLEAAVLGHFSGDVYDAVVPVPLHPVKRRERGYNQSALLAAGLSRRLGLPLMGGRTLLRLRPTPSQTRLTARQRLTNVKGAFGTLRPAAWTGKRVLLVDDVMTTGATVSACAEVLLNAGAVAVDVLTVARGI